MDHNDHSSLTSTVQRSHASGPMRAAVRGDSDARTAGGPVLQAMLCLSLLLVAAQAAAEGSVTVINCDVARVCDARGACEPGSGSISFRLEPLDRAADGSARYTLSYGDIVSEMRGITAAGPFLWTIGTERNALLASSDTEWLWHRLELSASPVATIRFLSCRFEQ